MGIMRISLDLAKTVFEVFGVDKHEKEKEKEKLRKVLKRNRMLEFFSQLEHGVVGIESCGGAH